ncbi:hypothetical protein Emed_004928 [Eimeria media]
MENNWRRASGLPSLLFAFFTLTLQLLDVVAASRAVTYGSAIALVHEGSGHRLYSGKIAWGSGSIGQAVIKCDLLADSARRLYAFVTAVRGACLLTAQPAPLGSSPPLWLVRPLSLSRGLLPLDAADAKAPGAFSSVGAAGAPVMCGAPVMLEHVGSQAVLRAGQGEAPLSPNNEVGAASGSEGLESRFLVECVGGGDVWRVDSPVKLKNALLDANLQASKQHAFNYSNCGRGCPIAGHLEVSVARGKPSSWSWHQQATDTWTAQPQLLFHAEGEAEESADDARDEL